MIRIPRPLIRPMYALPALFILLLPALAAAASPAARPNVLFIIVDDLCNHLGAYGNTVVQTPHFDALAARGVRFDRAYAQYPVCNPSRISFLSGLRPDTTGIYDNSTALRDKLPHAVTLPQRLREHGYFTASISKVFHVSQWDPRRPEERPGSWKLDDERSWDFRINTKPSERGLTGEKTRLPGPPAPEDQLHFRLLAEGDDDDQDDGQAVRDAAALFAERRDRPFFIAVGFRRPHAAWIAPKKYFDRYPLASLKLPDPGARSGVPALAFTNAAPNYGEGEKMLQLLQAYYAATTFMDVQLGRLLAALESSGHARNTIVVLIGDHGWHLGEHGMWHKGTLFEESARAPLVIHAPGMKGNGQACARVVEFVDLFPTLAELCGVPAPSGLAGVSLKPLLENPARTHDRPAYTQMSRGARGMGRSVRTERWRYTEWNDGNAGVELYDHATDPREHVNLAGDPAQRERIASLRTLLRAHARP